MATKLFFRGDASTIAGVATTHRGTNDAALNGGVLGWLPGALSTSAGASVVASNATVTVTGPTNGIEIKGGSTIPYEFLSPPVSADVTITGDITANIWASESNMSANVAINVIVDIVRANALGGTDSSNTIVQIVKSTRVTEVAVTTRAVNNFTTGMLAADYTDQTLNRGDRLRVRIFGDDAGTMASGFTFNASWNGGTGGADGDSFITFTETFSFESDPAGSQLFLTNAQSGLSGAPALISDFTGANESPLSEGGNWANLNSSGNPLQRISNAVSGSAAGSCRSYWTPANFGPDLEAYFTISTLVLGGIVCRVQGEGGAATWDGYEFVFGTPFTSINRYDNAAVTALIDSSSVSWASGDKFGVRIEGSTLQIWRQASGSSDWNLVLTAIDSTYSSAGKVGIFASGTTVRIDDFYAATDSNLFTQKAWTSRGAGVVSYVSDPGSGWSPPLLTQEWYTPQLSAVTLTGMAKANLRCVTSNLASGCSARMEIARVDSDGTNATVWSSWCLSPIDCDSSSVNLFCGGINAAAERAETCYISGDDLAISNGQRLRIRLYLENDSADQMSNAETVTFYYNGTSAAASGDSYITLAQTITEFVAAGFQPRFEAINHTGTAIL